MNRGAVDVERGEGIVPDGELQIGHDAYARVVIVPVARTLAFPGIVKA